LRAAERVWRDDVIVDVNRA